MKTSDQYHKWIEWNEEDQTCIGKCSDLIIGVYGNNPAYFYTELCEVVEKEGQELPVPKIRPMREVA